MDKEPVAKGAVVEVTEEKRELLCVDSDAVDEAEEEIAKCRGVIEKANAIYREAKLAGNLEAMNRANETIREAQSKMKALNEIVKAGGKTEMRKVACEVARDFDAGTCTVARTDTGEQIEKRLLTDEEKTDKAARDREALYAEREASGSRSVPHPPDETQGTGKPVSTLVPGPEPVVPESGQKDKAKPKSKGGDKK